MFLHLFKIYDTFCSVALGANCKIIDLFLCMIYLLFQSIQLCLLFCACFTSLLQQCPLVIQSLQELFFLLQDGVNRQIYTVFIYRHNSLCYMEKEIWKIQHWFEDSKELSYILWYSFLLFCFSLHNL